MSRRSRRRSFRRWFLTAWWRRINRQAAVAYMRAAQGATDALNAPRTPKDEIGRAFETAARACLGDIAVQSSLEAIYHIGQGVTPWPGR